MTRPSFHLIVTLLLGCFASTAAAATKPNIIVIVGDDMGYADVGFHGCKDIPTPHLDALAASGVWFTDGYVSGVYCSPTRAGLLTGRYQQRFGHEYNPGGGHGMPMTETTLADRLKAVGYKTGLVGKWHLGDTAAMQPQSRGFDEFFGFLEGGHDYFNSATILRGKEHVKEKEYLTDAFGREAVAFIDRHQKEPFFLYLAFNAVHTPRQADEKRLAKFAHIADERRRIYAAMMTAMDEAIGDVRKKLADAGLTENTLVTFISDNGGPIMVGTTANGAKNDPLRGSKRTTLEGGIRVPFVVSWPAQLKPGKYTKPVIQLDLHATALAAAGIDPGSTDKKLDGVDLLPFLAGKNTDLPHEALFWRMGPQMAVRIGEDKLVCYDLNVETGSGVLTPSKKKLYRLSNDLGETTDVADSFPEEFKKLQARWDAWNSELAAPLWGQREGKGEGKAGGAKKKKNKTE